MKFRTEICHIPSGFKISHDDRIVMLGSCFSDNIGERLAQDGFQVVHNPLGPLFNPESILNVLRRISAEDYLYGPEDLVAHDGCFHCLDFASRYQGQDSQTLLNQLNQEFAQLRSAISDATVLIITFGTNKVFRYQGATVGNCHKLPSSFFTTEFLKISEIVSPWLENFHFKGKLIFTLSPVRYPGDGLPQSTLSKSTLRVAIDEIVSALGADYFPAYEILNDDLRDYRFYGPDLRHPSDMAVDYVYECFADTYFDKSTKGRAAECHRQFLRNNHRPIIK